MELSLNSTDEIEVIHTKDAHCIFKFKEGDYKGIVFSFKNVKMEIVEKTSYAGEVVTESTATEGEEELSVAFEFTTVENPDDINTSSTAYRLAVGNALNKIITNAMEDI